MEASAEKIDEHLHALMHAFVRVLEAEDQERRAEAAIREVKDTYAPTLRHAKQEQEDAWAEIARLMAETGEVEVVLPDAAHDYKIAYTTTPEVVDVPDTSAVPDEFCKVERVPKKKEILEHLKALREVGAATPNWASITRNPGRLAYKLVKKAGA